MNAMKEARVRFEEGSFFDWYIRGMKDVPDAGERNHGELASRVCRLGAKSEVLEVRDVPERPAGRTIAAPDGTAIRIEHQGARRHEPECWRTRWANPDGGVDVTGTWDHEPTNEEVLDAYEKWRQSRARTVTAADGTRIAVNRCWLGRGWVVCYNPHGLTLKTDELRDYKHCPTDAEVLADYEAWKMGRETKPVARFVQADAFSCLFVTSATPDGTILAVVPFVVGDDAVAGTYKTPPTDKMVLADFAKWRNRQTIKRELADLEKRAAELRAKL